MGCAVAIGVIERFGDGKFVQSLMLLDPFTNYADAVMNSIIERIRLLWSSLVGRLVGYPIKKSIQWANANTWRSDQRIRKPVFSKIPLCVFSSTDDFEVPPEDHNRLFAIATDGHDVPVAYDLAGGFGYTEFIPDGKKKVTAILLQAGGFHLESIEQMQLLPSSIAKTFLEDHLLKRQPTDTCEIPARPQETLSNSIVEFSVLSRVLTFAISFMPLGWWMHKVGYFNGDASQVEVPVQNEAPLQNEAAPALNEVPPVQVLESKETKSSKYLTPVLAGVGLLTAIGGFAMLVKNRCFGKKTDAVEKESESRAPAKKVPKTFKSERAEDAEDTGEPGITWWHTFTIIFLLSLLVFGFAICHCNRESRTVRAHSLHEIVIEVPKPNALQRARKFSEVNKARKLEMAERAGGNRRINTAIGHQESLE